MIFKGFTDENGNVIPVQGAGTVYNEELNSLALGKGTSAIGQDQLVFGRGNVADANKVEVVGGGNGGDAVKIILTYGEPSQQFTLTRIGTSLDINEVNSKASSLMGRPTIFGYKNWTPGENDILVFYFWDRKNDGDGLYENYPFFIFLNGKVTHSTEKGMSGNNHRYWVYEPSATPTSVEEIVTKKNIRTLDWNGHEHLSGSLAIGEESVAGTNGQLVFGKKNIVDANKVEIVGGDGEVFNIESLPALNTNDTFIYKTNFSGGTTYDATYISSNLNDFETFVNSNISTLIPDFAGKTFDFKVADSMSSVEVLACFVIKNPTRHNPYNVYDNHFTIIVRYGSNGIYHFGISSTNVVSNNVSIEFGLVSESKKIISYKANGNVRTLDWQGNQWNAGDVTCDDGNGNTISMRDLLSRIATLEAAAAES